MNHALVSSVCSLLWLATPAKAFHGKHLTLVEKNASATQVIEQIVEVAHLSVIFVGHPEATLDLDAKNLPWDQVLDEASRGTKCSTR